MDFTTALQTAANAGAVSCMYAMIAVGLSLAFGVMQMANYAHGEFFMAGAYTVYAMYALGGAPYWAAVAAGAGIVCVLGLGVERGIFRPTRGKINIKITSSKQQIGRIFAANMLNDNL